MHSVKMDTPILLIAFNRPDTTAQVFQVIREVRPSRLFFAVDGPRLDHLEENEKVQKVRSFAEQVDWQCQLSLRFSEKNQGCGLGVSSAISWFFENVEEGIILEDDCVPDRSFFPFCQVMLERYRETTSVGHVGGFNVQKGQNRGLNSYYFSRYFHVWGWATWKRAWKDFDLFGNDYDLFLDEKVLNNLFGNPAIVSFWENNFNSVFRGTLDTWDYQWVFANFKTNRLSIIPNRNLVTNIGFGRGATHTLDPKVAAAQIRSASLDLDQGPRFPVVDRKADQFTYEDHLGLQLRPKLKRSIIVPVALKKWGKSVLRYFGKA